MKMFSGSEDYSPLDSIRNVYVIQKLWVDPLENRNADGYDAVGAFLTKREAEKWVSENQEYWGKEKCWSLYTPKPLYIITELPVMV